MTRPEFNIQEAPGGLSKLKSGIDVKLNYLKQFKVKEKAPNMDRHVHL